MSKLIYGVGISEAGKYDRKYDTPEYILWLSMIRRCYHVKRPAKDRAYEDCTVSPNFKNYQFFAEWCNNQTGYGKNNYQLDKDVLVKGNKVYSENTCVFIPHELNNFFKSRKAGRSGCVQGVSFDKSKNKYRARISMAGSNKCLGRYFTQEEAEIVYIAAKREALDFLTSKMKREEVEMDKRVWEAIDKYHHESQL